MRKNVLDVSYHVSQYQNIISELRSEIGRLKEKIVEAPPGGGRASSAKTSKKQGGNSVDKILARYLAGKRLDFWLDIPCTNNKFKIGILLHFMREGSLAFSAQREF